MSKDDGKHEAAVGVGSLAGGSGQRRVRGAQESEGVVIGKTRDRGKPKGIGESLPTGKELDALLDTQVSDQFLRGMIARMEMSFFKYGDIRDAYPKRINAIESLRQRLDKYAETGNTEYLIDAANFAMIEFMLPSRPDAFFAATDSDQSPGRVDRFGNASAVSNVETYDYGRDGD